MSLSVFDITPAGELCGSAQYVEGKTTKADNPHIYRLATYKLRQNRHSQELYMASHSPCVKAWLKTMEDSDQTPDDDKALAARLALAPAPAFVAAMKQYRTHAQRMAESNRKLDKANASKPPVQWEPITEHRATVLAVSKVGTFSNALQWPYSAREKSIDTAQKRGDIIPNIPNVVQNDI